MTYPKPREFQAGFAITTHDQCLIEENVRDRFNENGDERETWLKADYVNDKGEITLHGWDQLNDDSDQLERNALAWLRKTFLHAVEHGHDSYGDLVGNVTFDAANAEQAWLIELASSSPGRSERIDMCDRTYGSLADTAFDLVSAFGGSALGGQVTFDVSNKEAWEVIGSTIAKFEAQKKRKLKRKLALSLAPFVEPRRLYTVDRDAFLRSVMRRINATLASKCKKRKRIA